MNDITPFIVPIISAGALLISIISICYTYIQNRRRFEVNLTLENDETPSAYLTAYNSGYRSIAILKGRFLANNELLKIWGTRHTVDGAENGLQIPSSYYAAVDQNFNSAQAIKEGETAVCLIRTQELATFLHYNGYSGVVKLSGYFETVQRQKKYSNSIDFDIEKYFVE